MGQMVDGQKQTKYYCPLCPHPIAQILSKVGHWWAWSHTNGWHLTPCHAEELCICATQSSTCPLVCACATRNRIDPHFLSDSGSPKSSLCVPALVENQLTCSIAFFELRASLAGGKSYISISIYLSIYIYIYIYISLGPKMGQKWVKNAFFQK